MKKINQKTLKYNTKYTKKCTKAMKYVYDV